MRVLTIIGNGFDLGHKLPTSFDEFISSNKDVFEEKYELFKNGNNSWNEVEQRYSDLLLDAILNRETFDVIDEVDQIIQDYGLNDFGEVDYYNYTSDAFVETYNEIIKYITLLKDFEEDFLHYLKKMCSEANLSEIVPLKKLKAIINASNKIINFNYTNTIEVVYKRSDIIHIHGNIDDCIAIGSGALDDAKVSAVDYKYPTKNNFSKDKHGLIDMLGYYEYDLEGNLVERAFVKNFFNEVSLGISENEDGIFELLDKKSKSTLELRKKVIQDLRKEHYDLVYIIGHSLGDADKEVFDSINKDAKFIYFYHENIESNRNFDIKKRIDELNWECRWISNKQVYR